MATKQAITCPHCQRGLKVPTAAAGRKIRCPACSHDFICQLPEPATNSPELTATVIQGDEDTFADESEVSRPKPDKPKKRKRQMLGRFELKALLGTGSFGKVYKAYDSQLERFVALKIPTFSSDHKNRVARFLTEAKAAARLQHENIVSTYESGKIGSRYYIASEIVEGQSLAVRIAQNRIPLRAAVCIVAKLAAAIGYAHENNVVHRDVKPDNIMLDEHGEPQLMDFGLAKRTDDDAQMTSEGALMGTPAYMSPEQARGETANIGPATDQYSLGVVLYQLLTGETPYDGPPHTVVINVAKGETHDVNEKNSDIDDALNAIVKQALAGSPKQRYASCNDLADDLNRWVDGESVGAKPMTRLQSTTKYLANRKMRVASWTVAFALACFIVWAGAMLFFADSGVDEATAKVLPTTSVAVASTAQVATPSTITPTSVFSAVARTKNIREDSTSGDTTSSTEEVVLNSDTIPQVAVIADGGENDLSVATYANGNWSAQPVSGSVEFTMNPSVIQETKGEPELSSRPPPLSSSASSARYNVAYIVNVSAPEQRTRTENRTEDYEVNGETRTRIIAVEVPYTVNITREEIRTVVSDRVPTCTYLAADTGAKPHVECHLTTFENGEAKSRRVIRLYSVQMNSGQVFRGDAAFSANGFLPVLRSSGKYVCKVTVQQTHAEQRTVNGQATTVQVPSFSEQDIASTALPTFYTDTAGPEPQLRMWYFGNDGPLDRAVEIAEVTIPRPDTSQQAVVTILRVRMEQRMAARTVEKTVYEQQEESYTVDVEGRMETRTRTVMAPRTIQEQVPYTYTVTVPYQEEMIVRLPARWRVELMGDRIASTLSTEGSQQSSGGFVTLTDINWASARPAPPKEDAPAPLAENAPAPASRRAPM